MEIGLAFGVSSLYLCEALLRTGAVRHTIVDPYQHRKWYGAGLPQLQEAGYESLIEFTEQHPHVLLPQMLDERKEHLDLCFLDGLKRFDLVLTNAFYLIKMLRPGGVIFFDDVNGWAGVVKVCPFISQLPEFQVFCPCRGSGPVSLKSKFAQRSKRAAANAFAQLPLVPGFAASKHYFDAQHDLNVVGVGFQKTDEGEAPWDFFAEF
ncbi:MAG: class I SAM-dependent methyltransferase [Fuerstiella sp.]|nr:class I SAM-dependent methyltransferase [Fuerstiella sp.]